MNIIQLYQDFNIPHFTTGYKYCRPGWVNIDCPFCTGNPGPHLGFELASPHFFCWRCGYHSLTSTIAKLLSLNYEEADNIILQYKGQGLIKNEVEVVVHQKEFKLPPGSSLMAKMHKDYLASRKFDPVYLETVWNLKGTGPISIFKTDNGKIDYRFRIIIPFYWNKKIVSFDSRDITGKHQAKYMACPKEFEKIPHKEILYGKQSEWGETGICVEGPFDVFRFGVNSFATSGIQYTQKQLRIMAKNFKRIAVCYDGPSGTSLEIEAEKQANKLIGELKFRNIDAFRVKISDDPANMEQKEADYLVKQLIH